MPGSPPRSLSPWARAALASAALFAALLASSLVWRQGLAAAWDEVELQSLLQGLREGNAQPWGLGRGSLHHHGLAALLWLPGFQAGWLHAPVLLGLLLEGALLWRLVRLHGGEAAQAAVAVAVHFGSRLTWLRGATVLGFSLAPLWVLSAWSLALWVRGRALGLAAGLAAGLLLGDYEACLAAAPGLAWIVWRRQRQGGRGGLAFGAGLLGAWGFLILLQPHGFWSHFIAVRGHSLAQAGPPWWRELLQNLGAFFFGLGKPLQGADLGPALSWGGLALVLLGARRLGVEAWLFLGGGLLLLAAPSPGQTEAHRAAAAWAPLCLAAGLGLPAAGAARKAVLLLLALGVGADAWAYRSQRIALEPAQYEYSWRLEKAARALKGRPVLSELNFRSLGAFRLRSGSSMDHDEPPVLALLSGEQLGPRPSARFPQARPLQVAPELGTLWLVRLPPGSEPHWLAISLQVEAFLSVASLMGWRDQLQLIEILLREPSFDPFLKQVELDRALWAAKDVGLPLSLAQWAAQQPWLNARHCLGLAQALEASDPRQALRLVERAIRSDPARAGARQYRAELRARLKP